MPAYLFSLQLCQQTLHGVSPQKSYSVVICLSRDCPRRPIAHSPITAFSLTVLVTAINPVALAMIVHCQLRLLKPLLFAVSVNRSRNNRLTGR